MYLPEPLWESTIYFWVWEILATIFILTDFYLIWRISVLSDRISELTRICLSAPRTDEPTES